MTCPHCGEPVSRLPKLSPTAKRRWRIVLMIAVIVAVSLVAVWLLWPSVPKEAVVGTWRMEMPVGKAMGYFAQTAEDGTLAESMLSLLDEQETVTMYCRFFDNGTYQMYADPDEVITVADKALDAAAAYVCEEGIDKAIESGDLSDTTASLLLGVANASSDDMAALLGKILDKVVTPLYDKLRETMTPPEGTGRYRWLFEDGQLCMALQKETPVEDSVYVIWQYEDGTLRMVSGSFLDTHLEGLVWEKLADS